MSMNNIKQINPINEEEVKALKRIRGGGKQNKKQNNKKKKNQRNMLKRKPKGRSKFESGQIHQKENMRMRTS